jgi:hypothetical protein
MTDYIFDIKEDDFYNIIINKIIYGKYLIEWKWFIQSQKLKEKIYTIIIIFNSPDKIKIPLNCSISYDSIEMELEKEISFERHINDIILELSCQSNKNTCNNNNNIYICSPKYYENSKDFILRFFEDSIKKTNETSGQIFKAMQNMWLLEFIEKNYYFINTEGFDHTGKFLDIVKTMCLEFKLEKFEETGNIFESYIIQRYRDITDFMLELFDRTNGEYNNCCNKINYNPIFSHPNKKSFVKYFINNSLDSISDYKGYYYIFTILEIIKLFEFIIENYDYIKSDEFDNTKMFINNVYEKCLEFKERVYKSENVYEKSIINYFTYILTVYKTIIKNDTNDTNDTNEKNRTCELCKIYKQENNFYNTFCKKCKNCCIKENVLSYDDFESDSNDPIKCKKCFIKNNKNKHDDDDLPKIHIEIPNNSSITIKTSCIMTIKVCSKNI